LSYIKLVEKEKSLMNVEMEVGKNDSVSKPNRPPQEDFPWPQFASLAMNSLMNQWKLQPVVTRANYAQEESSVVKLRPKVNNHLFPNYNLF